MPIDAYIDFVSPYAYLGWRRAAAVLGHPVRPHVLLLGPILDHHGQLGPAEIAPKRSFTIRDTLRRAAEAGVPMAWPQRHPFNPVLATKVVHAAPEESRGALIDALFAAAWAKGLDVEDVAVVRAVVASAGLDADAVVSRALSPEISRALRAANAAALERGIFGVPTFVDESGEHFFGDDQLERIARKEAGNDALGPAARETARQVEARPMGIVRARSSAVQAAPAPPPAPPAPPPPPIVQLDEAHGAHVLAVYARARFLGYLGLEVVRVAAGETECAITVRDDHRQQDGFVHAGVLATLSDHNAGACAATMAPVGAGILTIEFKINLLRPSIGPRVVCRSKVLRAGKTVAIVESEVFDRRGPGPEETLVAKATVTLAVRTA